MKPRLGLQQQHEQRRQSLSLANVVPSDSKSTAAVVNKNLPHIQAATPHCDMDSDSPSPPPPPPLPYFEPEPEPELVHQLKHTTKSLTKRGLIMIRNTVVWLLLAASIWYCGASLIIKHGLIDCGSTPYCPQLTKAAAPYDSAVLLSLAAIALFAGRDSSKARVLVIGLIFVSILTSQMACSQQVCTILNDQ
jgi:hypothetical protein